MMLPGADRARRVPRLVSTKTGISGSISVKQTQRCGLCLPVRRSLGIVTVSFRLILGRVSPGERKIVRKENWEERENIFGLINTKA